MKKLLKIPQAPPDLFCKIRRRIQRRENALDMRWWHGSYRKDGSYRWLYPPEDVSCATAHCLAGWVTFLTPGGLELEKEIERRLINSKSLHLTPEVQRYSEFGHSSTGIAALLICHKAGLKDNIHSSHFTSPHNYARQVIWTVADLEQEKLELAKELQKKKAKRARERRLAT